MNIALLGYGKMGKTIEEFAIQNKHNILLRISSNNADELSGDALQNIDVAIEFSQPESAFHNIKTCLQNRVPVVSGTTGWLKNLEEAKELATKYDCGFIYASNFSIGVNLFFELNRKLAKLMDRYAMYQPKIHEIHHTQKLDAPSGTGISLGQDIVFGINQLQRWVPNNSQNKKELAITSERVGNTAGTHIVSYQSAIDSIEIKHVANNRDGFAKGALFASEWIIGKKGFYEMSDVLEI